MPSKLPLSLIPTLSWHCILFMYQNAYIYRMEGDLIHIKMHHDGSFSMEGPLTYDGGEVSIF